jgi:hypothetical protein
MASIIPQSSLQGSLFELIARGRKDAYFVKEGDTSVMPFGNAYGPSAPLLQERRTIVPLNDQQFGNTCEVEIDKYGDVMTECNLLITLPTWLPPLPLALGGATYPPQDANSTYWIKDTSGYSYGYCDYIGLFLFERIQLYQDSALIQEWSGDLLFGLMAGEGSWNSAYLDNQYLGGVNVGLGTRPIAYRATPGKLRLSLPLPGLQSPGDGGFPLCCAPTQSFRIRMKLRKLEDLVVSDNPMNKPTPWLNTFQYDLSGGTYTFPAVNRNAIGQPTILLETVQAYLSPETRRGLQESKQSIPFRRPFENIFTFGEPDFTALDVSGIAASTRRLDARHPVERVVFFFRTQNALDRNEYTNLLDPSAVDTQFYNDIKLIIAGRDREHDYGPLVWQNLQSYAKDEIDTGYNIGEFRWDLGDMYNQVRPFSRVPNGTVNFTTADRPTIYVQLNNVPPQTTTGERKSEFRVFMEGWNVYEFNEGRARLLFAN